MAVKKTTKQQRSKDENNTSEQPEDQGTRERGRPLKFETVEDLATAIQAYFDDCDPHIAERMVENGINAKGETIWIKRQVMTPQKPYLVSGLARYLGVDRKTLQNYKARADFFLTIQEALDRCEEYAESQLYTKHARGAQFSLNVNYGWREVVKNEHTGEGGGPIETAVIYRPEKLPMGYWKDQKPPATPPIIPPPAPQK